MADFIILAFLHARSGYSERLGERLLALVRSSRAEAGCLCYEVHRSNDDPDLWMVYENWRSADDLKAHFALPHMQAFMKEAPAIVWRLGPSVFPKTVRSRGAGSGSVSL